MRPSSGLQQTVHRYRCPSPPPASQHITTLQLLILLLILPFLVFAPMDHLQGASPPGNDSLPPSQQWKHSARTEDHLHFSPALSIPEAVQHALRENPQIRSVLARIDAAEQDLISARRSFGPTLGLSYGYEHQGIQSWQRTGTPSATSRLERDWSQTDLWTTRLSLNQDLFAGYRLLNSAQRASLLQDQVRLQREDVEISLGLAVQQAYIGLIQARQDRSSAERSVRRLEDQVLVADALHRVQSRPVTDKLQAQTRLLRARGQLESIRTEEQRQLSTLTGLLALPADTPIRFEEKFPTVSYAHGLEQSLQTALRCRQDIFLAALAEDIARKSAGITKSGALPRVTASASYTFRSDGPAFSGTERSLEPPEEYALGVGLAWEFDSGATLGAYQRDLATVRSLEADRRNTILEAITQVQNTHTTILESAVRLELAQEQLSTARENYRLSAMSYRTGVGQILDLLAAESDVINAELAVTEARSSSVQAIAAMYAALGVSNPSLDSMDLLQVDQTCQAAHDRLQ